MVDGVVLRPHRSADKAIGGVFVSVGMYSAFRRLADDYQEGKTRSVTTRLNSRDSRKRSRRLAGLLCASHRVHQASGTPLTYSLSELTEQMAAHIAPSSTASPSTANLVDNHFDVLDVRLPPHFLPDALSQLTSRYG